MKFKFSHQLITGLSFGLTTAVVGTMGIIVGLYSATASELAVVTGIIVMGIADGLADSMGIHLSEESEAKHSAKEIWLSTVFSFLSVSGFTLSFLLPILLFDFPRNIYISVAWGLALLSFLSFYLAKRQNKNPLKIVLEHNLIAIVVVVVTYYLGELIPILFASMK